MNEDVVAKATAALEMSVASILDCDEDDAVKRKALVETFDQFDEYMQKHVTGSKALSKFEKIFVAIMSH